MDTSTLQSYYRVLDHLFIPQKFMLVSYIDGIMVIGPSKKEVTTT